MNSTDNCTPLSLLGKTILITGVSRSKGIGAAIARTLARSGAAVILHGFAAYDAELGYPDAQSGYAAGLAKELVEAGYSAAALPPSDLSQSGEPERVLSAAADCFGALNGLVLNHAYSTCVPLGQWTEEHIDAHLHANVRAAMLLLQAFAAQFPHGGQGAVTLFTSGQYLGPMIAEIAYAVSKEATIGLCRQAAAALASSGIRVNCVNPGPVDTGYLEGEAYRAVERQFPAGRWGMPEDTAKLIRFLHSEEAAWITGQVIASEGGFQRQQP